MLKKCLYFHKTSQLCVIDCVSTVKSIQTSTTGALGYYQYLIPLVLAA